VKDSFAIRWHFFVVVVYGERVLFQHQVTRFATNDLAPIKKSLFAQRVSCHWIFVVVDDDTVLFQL
jgi:hypothetical protein